MLLMALRKSLILRKLRSGCLEGRTALIQPVCGVTEDEATGVICLVCTTSAQCGPDLQNLRTRSSSGHANALSADRPGIALAACRNCERADLAGDRGRCGSFSRRLCLTRARSTGLGAAPLGSRLPESGGARCRL